MHFLTFVAALAGIAPAAPDPDTIPLYDDLGTHHHEITTDVPLAQAYFDQGMRLTYAFNHQEAVASFRYAAELDPSCAMCWWGVALALGPNITAPMAQPEALAAYEAIRGAQAALDAESARERAYVAARRRPPSTPTASGP